jgi:phosphohistidine swiveling domain-containing protein
LERTPLAPPRDSEYSTLKLVRPGELEVVVRHLNAVPAHRCSSRLLSIEAELVGVARHRGRVPGCDVPYIIARRHDGLWELAEARDDLDAQAQLGLEVVLDPDQLARHAAHEARARAQFAAAATRAGQLDGRSSPAELRAAFEDLFDGYADFLAGYRLTNERCWPAARAWLEAELRTAGGGPELVPELLWIDMTDTATDRESSAWQALVRGADRTPRGRLADAVAEHARAFGHLFGDQVFGEIDVPAQLWKRLADGQVVPVPSAEARAAIARGREQLIARLELGERARAAVDAMRGLALRRLVMREDMLLCNARTRGFFDRIAERIGLSSIERPLLRFLSHRDIVDGLAGGPAVTAEVLDSRRRSGICELVGDEVRVWSFAQAHRPAFTVHALEGHVVQPGPVVIGHAVRADRVEDIDPARAAAGPGPHILVVPMLQPAMVVAASSFAAVLAAEGGLLSHAAMLAREYRIPCIIGLREVARLTETGRRIRVDPGRGSVELVPTTADPPHAEIGVDPSIARDDIVWTQLGGASELRADRFGGKACALQRMFATLPVPDGLCLSSDVTRAIADWDTLCHRLFAGDPERAELTAAEQRWVDDWFAQVAQRWRPPEPLRSALIELGPCMVRSSSIEEDLPGASSAGLLTSAASARPEIELPVALAEVLRSALSPAYLRYRRHRALSGPPPCPALLIQRRVACAASGVLTTWRPAGAVAGRLTVAVARGLAGSEAPHPLVFGVDPDDAAEIELYPPEPEAVDVRLAAHGLSRTAVHALCSLSEPLRRAGLDHFELEWCLDQAQRTFVVQVRDQRGEAR